MASWASPLPLAVLLPLLLVACSSTAAATSYTVGDGSGWTTGVDYTTWVASKNIKIGDNLGMYVCVPLAVVLHACGRQSFSTSHAWLPNGSVWNSFS